MIIYPTTDWNSYVSLIDANTIAADFIDDNFTALTDAEKEKYLKQSTLLIKLKIIDPLEETTPDNLKLATVYLANYSIGKNMVSYDTSDNVKRLKIDGALEKEYFSQGSKSNSFPSIVNELLSEYGMSGGTSRQISRA